MSMFPQDKKLEQNFIETTLGFIWKIVVSVIVAYLILAGSSSHAIAEEKNGLWLDAAPRYNIYNSIELDSDYGFELRVGFDRIFIFGSYDRSMLRLQGQYSGDYGVYGAGVGMDLPVARGERWILSLSGQIGYYYPRSTLPDLIESREDLGMPDGYHEGLWYEICHRMDKLGLWALPGGGWEGANPIDPIANGWITGVDYEISPAPGGAIALHFEHQLRWGFSAKIDVGYRYIKFPEIIRASGYLNGGEQWSRQYLLWEEERDFSGVIAGFSITYRF